MFHRGAADRHRSRRCEAALTSMQRFNVPAGHYRALEWDDKSQTYAANGALGIQVDVEACRHILSSFCL